MKKLLLQLDTSPLPSVFDRVVAHDGGADDVMSYGGVTPETFAIWCTAASSRAVPKDLRNTAIFVGGTDMAAGERLLGRRAQGVLRSDARVGDARLERLEHHGGGRGRQGGRRPPAAT